MKIVIGDVYSKVYTRDVKVIGILREACKARPKGYHFMPSYRDKTWDGFISLMKPLSSFPTGLLDSVLNAFLEKGYTYEISWGNLETPTHPYVNAIEEDILEGITLRPYQIDAAKALILATRGVAKMATNSGKTEVFAGMLKVLDKKSLVVVHRKELLHQTADRLEKRLGHFVGKIGDGINQPSQGVTVAMIQTLSNMIDKDYFKEWISSNEVLIVDECHHASSNQMMDVLYKVPGMFRFGFSGTPLKEDELADLKLKAITGKVEYDLPSKFLIDEGYSAVPTVYLHVIQSDSRAEWKEDYHSAYERQIVKGDNRNHKIIDLAKHRSGWGDVVLILVNRIEHGNMLAFETEGMYSTGEHTTEHRQHMLEQMRKGVAGVYVATTIFDEGVDVPSINTLILAGGGKSNLKLIQRIGRGLRAKEGENVIEIHDFIDDTNKHLWKHTEKRENVYIKEGFDIKIVGNSNEATISSILSEGN